MEELEGLLFMDFDEGSFYDLSNYFNYLYLNYED